jgi:hypothetical protein
MMREPIRTAFWKTVLGSELYTVEALALLAVNDPEILYRLTPLVVT